MEIWNQQKLHRALSGLVNKYGPELVKKFDEFERRIAELESMMTEEQKPARGRPRKVETR